MRIYIAGPMTGTPDFGRARFNAVAAKLTAAGHVALNPAVLPEGMPGVLYMPICLAMLEAAEAIYMLAGWSDSPGARIENEFAAYQHKAIYQECREDDRIALGIEKP